ncbi:2-succinylbenzoate--CoA ligase [Paraconexibacter sp. AEG42_29]|uniref:Long-chain-fatty-acid--CoA ligase n=1 Tax=Paraconexibacter sp. AEG42_29 TaxID=2997339 RepID=A0AAU7AX03_9ACTN
MLIDVLRTTAAEHPERQAIIAAGRTITYAELVSAAGSIAGGLHARGIVAVGCAVQDPVDVVSVLAAASAAGVEACVYPRGLDAEATATLAQRLGHETVLVDRGRSGGLTLDALAGSADDELPAPAASTVLILTTGTTGTPKGVRHDWARLLRAVRRNPDKAAGRWLLAYNINQFAAFQVLLHGLVNGATIVVPSSTHARDAIDAMFEHRVTSVSATPTFWRMLLGVLAAEPRELALEQITLGGEAAPASVIDRLRAAFPAAGISHIYAGTEFGSVVSVRDGLSGLPVSILDRDESADTHFKVVDGELHVRSRNAMLGYQGQDAAAGDGWHATGDLVEERDGRLHFVGRTVEIINVGGAKIHPLPLEELIASVPGVAAAVVYGRPNAITGQIVAADVVLDDGADGDAVLAGVRAACADQPAAGRPRRIRIVEALEVRGNKTVRTALEAKP